MERFICSLCDQQKDEWSNNAQPFPGRCCAKCNAKLVIPTRIMRIRLGLDPREDVSNEKAQ